jgi:hypothetical protein
LFYLPGPNDAAFAKGGINRSVFLAGDRLSARFEGMTQRNFTVSLWFWSGTSDTALEETEWILSRGTPYGSAQISDQIGLRRDGEGNRVLTYQGPGNPDHPIGPSGKVERWKWHHLAFAREGMAGHVFLDGVKLTAMEKSDFPTANPDTFFFGGSCTGEGNFEGRLDEIAVFDRALSKEEIIDLYRAGAP